MSHSQSKEQVSGGMPVVLHPKVVEFMRELDTKARAKSARKQKMLEAEGLGLGSNHVEKIHDKLWELTVDCSSQWIRYFFTIKSGHFVIVHAFCKKTNTTPRREIDLAKRRANE